MSIIWIGVADTEESTRVKAVDALVDSGCTIVHTERQELRIPGAVTTPSKWWTILAVASVFVAVALGLVWIWTDEANWGWTSFVFLGLSLSFAITATPVKKKDSGRSR